MGGNELTGVNRGQKNVKRRKYIKNGNLSENK